MDQRVTRIILGLVLLFNTPRARAGEPPVVITGPEQSQLDPDRQDGGLTPAAGVRNVEVYHATAGWTYYHHVDLAAWQGRLYVAWNQCERDEDVWPSRELYATSTDGVKWSPASELFPMGSSTAARMYFFHAPNGRMLVTAGLRTTREQLTERMKGAMVVREILVDHTLGPVFTLRPPTNAAAANVPPMFDTAGDERFVDACRQLLANKPYLEQADYGYCVGDGKMNWHDLANWPADEPSRDRFDRFGKAMAFYHRRDGALVATMKWGWVLVSTDEGRTWSAPTRPPTLVTGMAKVWGQRTGDGRYALAYNPHTDQRYPLVVVSGDDGVSFGDMRVVHGAFPKMRYEGLHKSPGPQYVRGISEWSSDGSFADTKDAMWLVYSVNKEDVYVARVALPVR
jgi:hypothetical protein